MTTNAPAIHEPADDLIDALIDLVEARQQAEPDLAHYVAETLAEGLGFDVTLTPPKPLARPLGCPGTAARGPLRVARRHQHRWRS